MDADTFAIVSSLVALACLVAALLFRRDNALVRNERVKLAATALNNLGVAGVIYGVIAPTMTGGPMNKAAAGFAWGVSFLVLAQLILRLLRPSPKV
jgi:hypothetical protein